ncbi:NAD(P)H-dependent oxidoreductase [Paraburkholderia sp. JPY432]|uniref:NAD(P)H-dependent oxidoreductase n=1 Tax=Paraburkholderia youngii TaxID=2782701 RepID=UPI001595BEFE|nr:NAD(P)H-dependent oxidoreductase [Paraburkholderia youngii]NVH75762.1 NAD(P)H-dependent oxidoreductase [Paraburkholderia youngii]
MNALIVYAHPEPKSMNGALKDAAVRALTDAGWQVEVSDLHAQDFRAAAGWEDFTRPVSPGRLSYVHEQRYATKGGYYSVDIVAEQEKVRRADLIIFQFPLWWYAVPAILKGWADRVLANGFAYDEQHMFEDGLLRGKRAMLSFTTGGTEAELIADREHTGTVDEFMRPFSGGVLKFTGMQVLPPFIAYAPASLDEAGRRSQILQYEYRLTAVAMRLDRIRAETDAMAVETGGTGSQASLLSTAGATKLDAHTLDEPQ